MGLDFKYPVFVAFSVDVALASLLQEQVKDVLCLRLMS